MKTLITTATLLFCASVFPIHAQKMDTLIIDSRNLLVSQLRQGDSRYLVYFQKNKNSSASDLQIWNIHVEEITHNGRKAFAINQKWDYKDTLMHTATSICDKQDFKPLYHESWWKGRGNSSYNPMNRELVINGTRVAEGDASKKNATAFASFQSSFDQYYLNWHLDMETFSMLPFKKNTTFLIPFYEFGFDKPNRVAYTVSGEDNLTGADGKKIACWLLTHQEPGNVEKYWISKETKEVLKLEQVINDQMYRYKIKLPE